MAPLVAFALVAIGHLAAQLIAPGGVAAGATQVLLMPALAMVLLASTPLPRSRLVRLTLLALAFSWLGDSLPQVLDGDTGFAVMLGCFLVAQLAYAAAFWPRREDSILRRPVLIVPYLAAAAFLVAWCWSGAGALAPAVVVYALAIVTMAVLATGIDAVAGAGAVLFLISDALIALRAFAGFEIPPSGFWVMLTYALGQFLIVAAVAHRDRADDEQWEEPEPEPVHARRLRAVD